MAPKGRGKKPGKKPKPPAVIDALSTEEMNKDQLEEHIIRLREELDREREEKSYFQLERDRVQSLWETSQRDLDQIQRDLAQKRREREEAEERHRLEINVYKQKLKHVLSEQHGGVSELKTEQKLAQQLDQNQNSDRELHLVRERGRLESRLREKEHLSDRSLRTLQLKQQVELMEVMKDYDRKVRDVEERFRTLSLTLRQDKESRLQQGISEVEEVARRKVLELQREQRRILEATEERCSTMITRLEAEHGELMEQQSSLKAEQSQVQKKLSKSQAENARLKKELDKVERLIPELRSQVEQNQRNKEQEKKNRAREKQLDEELHGLKIENTLLQQAFRKVEQERDLLKESHLQLVLDMQRKNGLREALLQRKLSVLSLELQRTEELALSPGLTS